MHHETLTVDFQREPFGVVDDDRGGADFEGADDTLGRGVFEGFLDGVVVEVTGAQVAVESCLDKVFAGGGDAVSFFSEDVGGFDALDGYFERGEY